MAYAKPLNAQCDTKGHCLCSGVELSAEGLCAPLEACHCTICRKWSGGPFVGIQAKKVSWPESASVTIFDSSEWAERGFCSHCGTHLFYRLKSKALYILPAGLMDALPELELSEEVFVDQQPNYYCFANKTERLTAKQVFERFTAQSSK